VRLLVDAAPGGDMQSVFTGGGAVLISDSNGRWLNRVPHLAAVITLYGHQHLPRVDVYDLSGSSGFAGTPVPRSMFDASGDVWFGFVGQNRLARLPVPPGGCNTVLRG
jgi:hypothetical protein